MKRGTALVFVAATIATFWLGGCASAQPAEPGDMVLGSLAEIPAAGANAVPYGSHVVLIPTHAETRATPELLAALERLSDELASAPEQSPSAAVFLGAPETGGFDSAASTQAINDLNSRYGFGLDGSSGAILLFMHGDPARAAREDVYTFVFETNDTTAIAQALENSFLTRTKGVGADAPHSLWELLELLSVPLTTPKPPHEQ